MLNTILDVLLGPLNTLIEIITFLIKSIEDIVYIIKLLKDVEDNLPALLSWLPSQAVTFLVLTFGVVILYKILGREG